MRCIFSIPLKSLLAALSLNAAIGSDHQTGGVVARLNNLETLMYNLGSGKDEEVPLLEVIEDLDRYFEMNDNLAFPTTFEFPKSF